MPQSKLPSQNKRNRVAVVYHFFAHYRGAVVRELAYNGEHDYTFFGDDEDRHAGIKPYEFPADIKFVRTKTKFVKGSFLIQSGLNALALSKSYDAVIYLGDAQYLTTWVSARLARMMGKRVLFWTIGWLRDERGRKDGIRCKFYSIAHGLLLYGRWAKKQAISRGFKQDNLYVVYNSLDYDSQREERLKVSNSDIRRIREDLFPGSSNPMVICSTRLVQKRRLDLLLSAAAILKSEGHELDILLVGDGPERPNLEKQATDLDLNVRFYGACYDESTVGTLTMASNLTVAPGMVGLTAMQSLAYGTPVVTHNDFDHQAPEWEVIEDGKSGSFFPFGDEIALAIEIKKWTTTQFPPEDVRQRCYQSMEPHYTPQYQRQVIDRAISGLPAEE